jgi:hypothetical protein
MIWPVSHLLPALARKAKIGATASGYAYWPPSTPRPIISVVIPVLAQISKWA